MDSNLKKYFVFSLLAICLLSLILGGINSTFQHVKTESEKAQKLQNVFPNNAPKIALLKLNGEIAASSQTEFFKEDMGAQSLLKSLKAAREDNSVKAVILKINSPGGTVAMSQNIYNEVLRVRKIKPVIVVMEDVAASGGYYIASASDRIIAQEGTLTGSIGVIMQLMDAHKLLSDKLGIKSNVIKSGTFKDSGSMTREMTQAEKDLFQNVINDSYKQFVSAIEKGRIQRSDNYSAPKRDLTKVTLKKYADGRIFTGSQAYEYGFIDAIGDMELADIMANKMASEKFGKNYTKLPVENYNIQSGFSQMLFGGNDAFFERNMFSEFFPKSMNTPKTPLYLWE